MLQSTWRLYDDKDISVNDVIELIDKVDVNPATWRPIGTVRILGIIEKPLGEVASAELPTESERSSKQKLLELAQRYYGPQVSLVTPVKVINFGPLLPTEEGPASGQVLLKEVKLYADGGSRGNPGPSAAGYVISDMSDMPLIKKGMYLGVTTNNQAEYQALKLGLGEALRMGVKQVHVYMDSLLVVNQMIGAFKVKNRDLWPIHDIISKLVVQFTHVSFTHVPRELNKTADQLVNEALNGAAHMQ